MPLNRTWWNNLIDDDGSGLVGTVWNKAVIAGQLDMIDAMWASSTLNFSLIGTGGGTPTYSARSGVYARSGNLLQAGGRVTLTSKGSLSGALILRGVPVNSHASAQQTALYVSYFGGLVITVASLGGYIGNNSGDIVITYAAGGGVGASANLDASAIGNTFDMLFAISYVCN